MGHVNKALSLLLAGAFGASTVSAEGLRIYGHTAEAQARAEAVVASAEGTTAVVYNPALLTRMEGSEFSMNVDNLMPVISFTDAAGTKHENNEIHFAIPSVMAAHSMGRWAFGLAVYAPFGLGADYPIDTSFRYETTGGMIQLINVNPTVAVKVSDSLSLAAGVMYYKSQAEIRQQYPWFAVNPAFSDGSLKVEGKGTGLGGNAALAWSPKEGHTLGLTYRSQVVVNYDGEKAVLTGPTPVLGASGTYYTDVKTTLRYPDIVAVGYAWKPSDKSLVEVGGHWANWTDFTEAHIDFAQNAPFLPDSTKHLNWKNTFALRAGYERSVSGTFSWTAGYAYDRTPKRESTWTPLVPDVDHHVFSAGGSWKFGQGWTLATPVTLIFQGGSSSINSEVLDATGQPASRGQIDMFAYKIGLGLRKTF